MDRTYVAWEIINRNQTKDSSSSVIASLPPSWPHEAAADLRWVLVSSVRECAWRKDGALEPPSHEYWVTIHDQSKQCCQNWQWREFAAWALPQFWQKAGWGQGAPSAAGETGGLRWYPPPLTSLGWRPSHIPSFLKVPQSNARSPHLTRSANLWVFPSCMEATPLPFFFFFNINNLYPGVSKQSSRHTLKYI